MVTLEVILFKMLLENEPIQESTDPIIEVVPGVIDSDGDLETDSDGEDDIWPEDNFFDGMEDGKLFCVGVFEYLF